MTTVNRGDSRNPGFHRQVVLPELGFSVDEGLEDLIRACWRRGIATCGSCIGGFMYGPDVMIVFSTLGHAFRLEDLTGSGYDYPDDDVGVFDPDEEGVTNPAAYFPAADIPALVEVLVDDVDPFTREVRRRRLEHDARRAR